MNKEVTEAMREAIIAELIAADEELNFGLGGNDFAYIANRLMNGPLAMQKAAQPAEPSAGVPYCTPCGNERGWPTRYVGATREDCSICGTDGIHHVNEVATLSPATPSTVVLESEIALAYTRGWRGGVETTLEGDGEGPCVPHSDALNEGCGLYLEERRALVATISSALIEQEPQS